MPLPTFSSARRWVPVALASVALLACKGVEQASTVAGPNDVGGTMVVAIPADASMPFPFLMQSIQDHEVSDLLYDRLAEIGPELNAVGDRGFTPQLAERWQWAPDSMSIAFHVNAKARWHDGVPVRASDVRFSFNLERDPALGSPAIPLITNIDSVAVKDSLTAVVWFKRHTPEQFYDFVYQVPIVPEHILANTPAASMRSSEVIRRGIGSGRFRLARWEPGQRLELVADTGNYRGRAKLDRIVFSLAPDYNSSVTRLLAGDADMHEQLRPEVIDRMKGDTVHRLIPYPSLQYAYLAFNLVDPKQTSQPHPVFGDRNVRRALSMAVDRRAMLRNVFGELGKPLYGPFPRSLSVADTTLPQLPYDTLHARALLDSAGWTVGVNGIRSKGGRPLQFSISTPNSSGSRHQYSVLLQAALQRVGASVKIDETDFGTYSARQATHNFDAEIAQYGADPGVSGIKQSWSTAGIAKDGSNFPSYSNPTVDALLDSATATFDPARARAYSRRAFETIIEDAPGVWLFEAFTVAGVHKRIRTTPMRADAYWAGFGDWWIPSAERTPRDKIGLRPTP